MPKKKAAKAAAATSQTPSASTPETATTITTTTTTTATTTTTTATPTAEPSTKPTETAQTIQPSSTDTPSSTQETKAPTIAALPKEISDPNSPEDMVNSVVLQLAALTVEAKQTNSRLRIPGPHGLVYEGYDTELQLPLMQRLIEKDLSEPYSVFTYRYFLNNWPDLCFLAMKGETCVGTIICKLGPDKKGLNRGYIAMLAVDSTLRKMGIGSTLVKLCIAQMQAKNCDVVVLETELTNTGALALYEKLDFVRDKRLMRYYLNGVDAFRLKLWLTPPNGCY